MINYKSYSDEKHEFVSDHPEVIEDKTEVTVDDTPIGVVNTHEIYIRSGAGKEFDPVTTVKEGAELMILDAETYLGWYQVMTASGVEGYVMSSLVDLH